MVCRVGHVVRGGTGVCGGVWCPGWCVCGVRGGVCVVGGRSGAVYEGGVLSVMSGGARYGVVRGSVVEECVV